MDLISHGFTRGDLLNLMVRAADMGVALYTSDNKFDGRGLLPLLQQPTSVPTGPTKPRQIPAKPQGGRPATAMAQSPEILRLRDEGVSAAKIAKQLALSSRSVLRVIHAAVPG
jgi:DNA-binding NarL/FixJ family response regulator